METSLVALTIVFLGLLLRYLWPLIVHRLKTKRVKVTTVDFEGKTSTDVLYLYHDDPLWDVVNQVNASNESVNV